LDRNAVEYQDESKEEEFKSNTCIHLRLSTDKPSSSIFKKSFSSEVSMATR